MLAKVPRFGRPQQFVTVDLDATAGATIGVNVWNRDGTLYVPAAAVVPDDDQSPQPAITIWRLILEVPPNVTALANTNTSGFYVVTGSGASATREIRAADGRIVVSNGDGIAGDPVVDLAEVTDSGVGAALMKRTIDAYGRAVGSEAATTDDLAEGSTNLYYTDDRVIELLGEPDTDLLAIYTDARDAP